MHKVQKHKGHDNKSYSKAKAYFREPAKPVPGLLPTHPTPRNRELTRREFLNLFIFNEYETQEQAYTDADGKEKKRIVPVLDRKGNPKKVKLNP
ncbi:MAG: hypothetical protein ICV81_01085, partial [Flavisolibacter sp.]|nr:hypothetical protein [Flavisolibacter sp.]